MTNKTGTTKKGLLQTTGEKADKAVSKAKTEITDNTASVAAAATAGAILGAVAILIWG